MNQIKTPEEIRRILVDKTQRRMVDAEFDRAKVDGEKRTVEMAFSSEVPVERWFGMEILDHSPAAGDFSRLKNKAALLWNHDRDAQIGVVEDAWIENKIGRARVRFSKNPAANEHFQDVLDGIKSKVSFAYAVDEMVLQSEEKDAPPTYLVKRWMPYELSLVSIPADDSVGIGREHNAEDHRNLDLAKQIVKTIESTYPAMTFVGVGGPQTKRSGKDETIMPEPKTPTPEEIERQKANRKAEYIEVGKRYADRVTGGQPVIDKLIEAAIDLDQDPATFRGAIFERVKDNKPLETPASFLDLSEKDQKRYSISRAIMAAADPKNHKAEFEFECSTAIAKQSGRTPQGFFVPYEMKGIRPLTRQQIEMARIIALSMGMRRDLSATSDGSLVGTQLMGQNFIDVLRNRAKTLSLGVQILSGLNQNVAIPKKSAASSAYWVATEGNAPTESEPTFTQVALDPKTVGTFTDYTRQLLIQSNPSVDALVQDDLIRTIALGIDNGILNGTDASGEPEGLVTVSGTGSVDGAGLAWGGAVEFETDVASANADVIGMAFLMPAAVRGTLKQREKSLNTAKYVIGEDGLMNGYPVAVSEQVAANNILFGDWTQAILAEFGGGLDILVDPYTASSSGTIRVRALQSVDVGFRQPGAFSICTNFS